MAEVAPDATPPAKKAETPAEVPAETPEEDTRVIASSPLTPEEMDQAARIDGLSIPGPGELMAAMGKQAKPNWKEIYREPIPTAFPSRAQIALNVGGLIADGYLALQAEDSQQIKNVGKDIITLAKSIAVSETVIARGKGMEEFAEQNEWNALREELEATQNEVKLALEQQRDGDLVVLITIGGWLRSTEAATIWLSDNYTPGLAQLLRQPGIVGILRRNLKELPEKIQNDPAVVRVNRKLEQIEGLVSFSTEAPPSPEEIKQLRTLSSAAVAEIISKKEKK